MLLLYIFLIIPRVCGLRFNFNQQTLGPYANYFNKQWGNAPDREGNFQLWREGAMKGYRRSRNTIDGQRTKSLPAYNHYFDKTYDAPLDTPYDSNYALFSGKEYPDNYNDIYKKDGKLIADCSSGNFTRPCFVREGDLLNGRVASNETRLDKGFIKIDQVFAKSDGDQLPKNFPPPPPEPPAIP